MKKVIAILIGAMLALTASAVTISTRSTQETLAAGGIGQAYDAAGVVTKYFSYTTAANATNTIIALVKVPAYSRIIDGAIAYSAQGGAQTAELGLMGADGSGYWTGTTADDPNYLLTAASVSNAVTDTFCNLVAGDTGACMVTTKEVYLIVRPDGATFTTNDTITGYVKFIR